MISKWLRNFRLSKTKRTFILEIGLFCFSYTLYNESQVNSDLIWIGFAAFILKLTGAKPDETKALSNESEHTLLKKGKLEFQSSIEQMKSKGSLIVSHFVLFFFFIHWLTHGILVHYQDRLASGVVYIINTYNAGLWLHFAQLHKLTNYFYIFTWDWFIVSCHCQRY